MNRRKKKLKTKSLPRHHIPRPVSVPSVPVSAVLHLLHYTRAIADSPRSSYKTVRWSKRLFLKEKKESKLVSSHKHMNLSRFLPIATHLSSVKACKTLEC
jgi:hypothetical protein